MQKDITFLAETAAAAKVLRLFLDYDGTLAEFSPSPAVIQPNEEVISLVKRLAASPGLMPAVISGRRLIDIKQLLPVEGLLLAGTYGIEVRLPDGHEQDFVPLTEVRPLVRKIVEHWQKVIAGLGGFNLEDKGWTVALHGRYASVEDVNLVMQTARSQAQDLLPGTNYRLLGGDRFLEFAPAAASKSRAVEWVLREETPPGAMVVYLGDDDKDEEAFAAVLEAGGTPVRVAAAPVPTRATFRLAGPPQVRSWLEDLLANRAV